MSFNGKRSKAAGNKKTAPGDCNGNILTDAYATDGKSSKAKRPKKRKNEDIDDDPLVVIDPSAPSTSSAGDPSASLKGKRKKKVPECPNPLFLSWLEEWKTQARAKENTNLSYVYSKAVKSLKKYPTVMESGQACAILENFGPKLCKMLDERLAEHRLWMVENNSTDPTQGPSTSTGGITSALPGSSSSSSVTSSGYSGNFPSASATFPSMPPTAPAPPTQPATSASKTTPTEPITKKPRRDRSTSRSRDYIPLRRSGAYAILVALHQALPSRPFLSKKQLMEEAQEHCDVSFQKNDPDSYYTAWSSMKTLLAKELVKKESCPAKFSLTEAGLSLALRLSNADESFSQPETGTPPSVNINSNLRQPHNGAPSAKCHEISLISSDEDDNVPSSSHRATNIPVLPTKTSCSPISKPSCQPISSDVSSETLRFIYLDYDHNEVPDKDSAAVTFDSVVHAGFLVKCRRFDLISSGVKYSPFEDDARRRSLSGGNEGWFLAYLANDDCPERAPGLGTLTKEHKTEKASHDSVRDPLSPPSGLCEVKKRKKKRKMSGNRTINMSFDDVLADSDDESPLTSPLVASGAKNVATAGKLAIHDAVFSRLNGNGSHASAVTTLKDPPVTAKDPPTVAKKKQQRRKSVQDALEVMVPSPQSRRTSTAPPLFTLKPGSFEVFLIVDTAEVSGGPSSGGAMRKDATVPELNRNGVAYVTRRMAVGDFAWVARENAPPHREVVLDFIVERKRMDDLASSIIDGRFREQKYRLKQCGLGHVVYLIEEYGHKTFGNGTMPESSLRQAISNVQIVDGFHVVHCKDPKDVVGYLSIMTRYLRDIYADKTLIAVPHATFTAAEKLLLEDRVQYVFTFDEFGRVAEKNKDLSVRELFAKQLMVLAGISADRAFAIVEQFPAPEVLMRKYEDLGSAKEREEMLKDLKCGLTQRKLGLAISKMLAQLYCLKGPLK